MEAEEGLSEIKTCLEGAFGDRLRGVVLYGSEARGESGSDSDIDVLVLLKGSFDYGKDLRQAIHAVYPLVLEWERPISVKPVEAEEYERQEWPLYKNARREGIVA